MSNVCDQADNVDAESYKSHPVSEHKSLACKWCTMTPAPVELTYAVSTGMPVSSFNLLDNVSSHVRP